MATDRLQRFASSPGLVYAVALVLLFLIALRLPGVLTQNGLLSLLVLAAVLGIAAVGQTLAVVVGGIDISIPAVIGMADVLLAYLTTNGWPFPATVLIILGVAALIGCLNGVISSALNLHPLVVTLATGSIVSGGVLEVTQGRPGGIVPSFISTAVSPIGRTWILPLPAAVTLWVIVGVLIIAIEHRTVIGRRAYALGANSIAARLALIRPVEVRAITYALSAMCAAVSGILLGGFSGGASADIGSSYLFSTVTAVVVGGTSLLGGRGGYGRTIAGVLITTEITTLLIGLGFTPSMQQALLGILILALIAVYGREARVAAQI
jgi:ribose transport system permease protein